MGRKEHLCILGGAFDPPTLGHMNLGRAILENTDVTKVWLMPIYKSMDGKAMSNGDDRLDMLIRSCADFKVPQIITCSYEIRNKFEKPTVEVLARLSTYIDNPISFCIGTDQANAITGWDEWEKLISTYNFIIFSGRAGKEVDLTPWEATKEATCTVIHRPDYVPDVSSTMVRDEIAKSGNSDSVTPTTMQYIKERGLYVKN